MSAGDRAVADHDRAHVAVGVGLERVDRGVGDAASMPRPRIASATSAPMSGSSVVIGCGAGLDDR